MREVAERDAELRRLRHQLAHQLGVERLRVAPVERRLGAPLPALQPRQPLLELGVVVEQDRDGLGARLQVEQLVHRLLADALPRREQHRRLLHPDLGLLELLVHLLDLELLELQLLRLAEQPLRVGHRQLGRRRAAARRRAPQDVVGLPHPLLAALVARRQRLGLGARLAQRLGLRVQLEELA